MDAAGDPDSITLFQYSDMMVNTGKQNRPAYLANVG